MERVPFLETLSVTSATPLHLDDAEDDLAREKALCACVAAVRALTA